MRARSLPAFVLFFSLSVLVCPPVSSSQVIPTVDWRDLSDRNVSRDGREALQIYRDTWQHAESEHFIYHFHDRKQSETVFEHAEAYYQWVKDMLGVEEGTGKPKCHIFIFEDKLVWDEFNRERPNERLPGAEAYTNGSELFIYREPFYLAPQKALAHEITHIVVHRFIEGRLPLFLNEGLSEHISYKALALQASGNDYAFRTVKMIPEDRYLSVERISGTETYPDTDEEKEIFYRESELLVRYLALNFDKAKLLELLRRTAAGDGFRECLNSIYGMDLDSFEKKFRTYGIVSSQR